MVSKVSIIGAGNVGAVCAQRIIERGYANVILFDIIEGLPQGKALDISESAPILKFDTQIIGTNQYEETANSDVVIITSGIRRKPGMARDELLQINKNIIQDVVVNIVKHSPNCIIISATNPVDVMTYLALQTSKFDRNRVIGLSGVLDSSRLRSYIATELNVSVENVDACVMGQHGDAMVIIPRLSTVSGIPITRLLPEEKITQLVERTRRAGAQILALIKTNSAFYAPSAALAHMTKAILLDKKQIMPCAAYLDGEYGIKDTVLGVPVKLGRAGIEQIIELELTNEEKSKLASSAKVVHGLINNMNS